MKARKLAPNPDKKARAFKRAPFVSTREFACEQTDNDPSLRIWSMPGQYGVYRRPVPTDYVRWSRPVAPR